MEKSEVIGKLSVCGLDCSRCADYENSVDTLRLKDTISILRSSLSRSVKVYQV